MKYFLDTTCLVAAFQTQNHHHQECFGLVKAVVAKEVTGAISAHSIMEVYSVLTRLPGELRVPMESCREIIEHNIRPHFEIIVLTDKEYFELVENLAKNRLGGGITYDALILKCAEKSKPDKIYTLNANHFRLIPSTVSSMIQDATSRRGRT